MSTRPIESADIESVLALNADNVVATSPLDHAALTAMLSEAFRASVIGPPASSRQTEAAGWKPAVQAFLIAFDQTANYSSPNFLWFRERFARFVYVDRIVVAEEARKQGLARTLYQDVFDAARAAGHERVACEVNYAPPNSVSDAFHESLGFTEIGRAALAKDKGVRYLMASLT